MRYRRDAHRIVGRALQALDGVFLADAHCFFGGGTYLALQFGEYRVSRDIDFLCSNRAGFRMLRETVTERSLGAIVREPVTLARDVRADRDGIRTFIEISELHFGKPTLRLRDSTSRSKPTGPPCAVISVWHSICSRRTAGVPVRASSRWPSRTRRRCARDFEFCGRSKGRRD
jgi:hypothetical protein